jgi:hypothetical protein
MWGVIAVQSKNTRENPFQGSGAMGWGKNRAAIAQLAQSNDAKKLMELLQQRGGVQQAAQAAAGGDPSQLMAMMEQLMQTKEGAELVDRIGGQAKQAGLE